MKQSHQSSTSCIYWFTYSLIYFIIQGISCPHFSKEDSEWFNSNPGANYYNLERFRCTFWKIKEPTLFPRLCTVGKQDESVSSYQNMFLIGPWFADCLRRDSDIKIYLLSLIRRHRYLWSYSQNINTEQNTRLSIVIAVKNNRLASLYCFNNNQFFKRSD